MVMAEQRCAAAGNSTTIIGSSFGSAATNRLQLMLFSSTSTSVNMSLVFSLERTKDATGADTGAGLLVTWGNGDNSGHGISRTQYVVLPTGANPPQELGVCVAISNQNSPTAFSSAIGISLITHFAGVAQPPGIGLVATNRNDFVGLASFTMIVYGSPHIYQLSGRSSSVLCVPTSSAGSSALRDGFLGILFE